VAAIDVDKNPSHDPVPSSAAVGTGPKVPHEEIASVPTEDVPITASKDLAQAVDTTTAV
jgi:hypothetical protein